MSSRYPSGFFSPEAPFQFTLILSVESIIRSTIHSQPHRNRVLSFFGVTYEVKVITACIKHEQTIRRILHPVRVGILIHRLLIQLLQFLCMNIISIIIMIKVQPDRLIVFLKLKRKIRVYRRVSFLRISGNFAQKFCIVKQKSSFFLLRIDIIILSPFASHESIIEAVGIINKNRTNLCGIFSNRILLQQSELFRQLIIRFLLRPDISCGKHHSHQA